MLLSISRFNPGSSSHLYKFQIKHTFILVGEDGIKRGSSLAPVCMLPSSLGSRQSDSFFQFSREYLSVHFLCNLTAYDLFLYVSFLIFRLSLHVSYTDFCSRPFFSSEQSGTMLILSASLGTPIYQYFFIPFPIRFSCQEILFMTAIYKCCSTGLFP